MSILVNKNSRVLIQGITGKDGSFHTRQMMAYGANVVAGISPGHGGEWGMDGKVPIFDSVRVAVEATGANVTVLFVPARFAADAMFEAVDAEVPLVICITEGIPIMDTIRVCRYARQKNVQIIGPNCPGVMTPGEISAGIIPGNLVRPGNIGVVSRSGTLTYEVLFALARAGMGVSTCVGIGGDPIIGTGFVDCLSQFEEDPHTDQIVLIGEIGGMEEENAAEYISRHMTKPVVAMVTGLSAPPGKRMGHAGAIIEDGKGTASGKISAFQSSGVRIARHPEEIPLLLVD